VRPFAGTDQAWYGEDALGEESVTRGSALYGGDVSMKFFGVLRECPPDGPGGLRHVMEPRVRYTGVSDPTHDPVSIYDFDEHDDLLGEDVVTVELINRLQTKRESPGGDIRTVDFLALGLSADYFPTGDGRSGFNSGRDWDRLRSRLLVRPHEALELMAAADSDLNGRGLMRLETGFTLGRQGASALRIDYRLLEADPSRGVLGSEQIAARLDTPLHGKWRLRAAGVMEFEDNASAERGAQSWSVALARDFHDWEIAVSYSVDKTGDDRLAFVNFTPKGYSRNLVRGSSEILPVAPDYSPVTDAAPEPGEW
jgi:hypothetical protein